MKTKRISWLLAWLFLTCLLWPLASLAHSALESSIPASGSIVAKSPERLVLNFIESTRLTSVQLISAAEPRQLTFEPIGSAVSFTLPAPTLAPGRNEIQWRALSLDGHVVEGSIIIVVRADR